MLLTELLFSLSGTEGLLFSETSNVSYDFLHPGEEKMLSKLLNLGRYAKKFQKFVEDYNVLNLLKNHLSGTTEKSPRIGYYESAFAEGVKSILSDYRSNLVRLESNIRSTQTCRNLFYVNAELQKYFLIFPLVESALDKIIDEKLRGCALLNVIHENLFNGIPSVNECFDKIRQCCNFLFANQLVEWLMFGSVVDKFNEFFIQKRDDKFVVREELCPTFLSTNQIEKILFIGEKVRLIVKENSSSNGFAKLLDEMCIEIRSILIEDNYDPMKLEHPIEKIRKALSELLWNSVVNTSDDNNDDNLFYCLNIIKDYYFLGKGELFFTLVEEIDENVCKQNRDLNKILQNSFVKIYGGDGSVIFNDLFQLKFVKNKDGGTQQSADLWGNCLDLNLKTSEKLKLIFDEKSLGKCRQIFHFLFKIRRVQINLNKCWTQLLKNRRKKMSSVVLEAKIWRINNLMLFLVTNLQYYLHVDVLDSFYKVLHNELTYNVNEFQRASDLVNDFVRNIGISCFMESKEIGKIVDGVLNDCEKFAHITLNCDDVDGDKSEKVQNIFVTYERHSSLLFKVLSQPKTHLSNPHLSQLLQRLDFNSYFSSTNLF